MANTNQAQTISGFKRLAGRANTSANKAWHQENIPSALQGTTQTVIADAIPQLVTDFTHSAHFPSRYATVTGSGGQIIAELVPFVVENIAGTLYDDDQISNRAGEGSQNSGYHGWQLKLPPDYVANTSNPASGTGFFVNNQVIHESNGALQLIGPPLAPNARPHLNTTLWTDATDFSASRGDNYNGIPVGDPVDWVPDYFNGTIFFQDYDSSKEPAYAMAWLYLGKMADEAISDAGGSGGSAITVTDEGASPLTTGATSFDFVGSGITATSVGNAVTVTVPGSISSYSRTVVTANATSSATDSIIGVSSSGNTDNIELRLTDASNLSNGQYFTVKKEDNYSSTITISCSSGDKIDGEDSIVIHSPFGAVNIYSDGTGSYFIYQSFSPKRYYIVVYANLRLYTAINLKIYGGF